MEFELNQAKDDGTAVYHLTKEKNPSEALLFLQQSRVARTNPTGDATGSNCSWNHGGFPHPRGHAPISKLVLQPTIRLVEAFCVTLHSAVWTVACTVRFLDFFSALLPIMGRLIAATLFVLFTLLHSSLACPKCPYPTPSNPHLKHHPKLPPEHPPKAKPYPKPKPHPPKPPKPPVVGPPKPPPVVQPPLPPVVVPHPPPYVMPPPLPPVVNPPPVPPVVGPPKPPPVVYPPVPPVVGPPKPPPVVYPPVPPVVGPPKPPPVVYPPVPPVVGPPKPPPVVYPPKPPPPEGEVPCPPPPPKETCPVDTLKLGACVDLIGGMIPIRIGADAKSTCCPVLQGLAALDAALCLCTTIKAKLLNLNLVLPVALEMLIGCGKSLPPGYQCPA
ncbi:hypothetical protein BHE74_00038165 [Ensete ventricosum]|nr:hypothetical protein BHE74_00038165 [Ensete ventricosum]